MILIYVFFTTAALQSITLSFREQFIQIPFTQTEWGFLSARLKKQREIGHYDLFQRSCRDTRIPVLSLHQNSLLTLDKGLADSSVSRNRSATVICAFLYVSWCCWVGKGMCQFMALFSLPLQPSILLALIIGKHSSFCPILHYI